MPQSLLFSRSLLLFIILHHKVSDGPRGAFSSFFTNNIVITQQEGQHFTKPAFIFSHINFINCIIKSFAIILFFPPIRVYFTHLFPLYQNHHFVHNRVKSSLFLPSIFSIYVFNSIKWGG